MLDEIVLVSKSDTTRTSIGTYTSEPVHRTVLCETSGIQRSEWAAAAQQGHRPRLMVTVASIDYEGEVEAIYRDQVYSIYRTHDSRDGWETELYLEARVGVGL